MIRWPKWFASLLLVLTISSVCHAVTKIEFATWDAPFEDIIKEFNRTHPDIQVDYSQAAFGEHHEKALLRLGTGDPPDVMMLSFALFVDYAKTGALLPLGPYIERDAAEFNADDIFPVAMEQGRYNGKQYALGIKAGGNLIYANHDIFSAAGATLPWDSWTWPDFSRLAKKLSKDVSGDGIPEIWGYTNVASWAFWGNLGITQGAPFWEEGATQVNYDTNGHRQVFAFIKDLVDLGAAPINNASFNDGQAAMTTSHVVFGNRLEEANPSFEWFVYANPLGKNGRAFMNGIHPVVIAKDSKHPEAAWELVKYLTSTEVQARLANMGAGIPLRKSAISRMNNPRMTVFAQNMIYGYRVIDRAFGTFNGAINKALGSVLAGEKSIVEALDEAEVTVNAALAEYR